MSVPPATLKLTKGKLMECELCDYRIATLEVSDGAYSFFVCSQCSDALGETWLVMSEGDVRA